MKPYGLFLSVLMVVVVPAVIFLFMSAKSHVKLPEDSYTIVGNQQMILVIDEDIVKEMKLDDYIVGVILGELPDTFEMSTLKAQAVAVRTYTLRRVKHSGLKHECAHVCTNHVCCQAYTDPGEYQNTAFLQKVQDAVTATSNQVLIYNNDLIEATYFSCSGGRTEDAVSVWGTDIPYLKSVDSPGEEMATYYTYALEYTREEFLSLLGLPEALLLYDDSIDIVYSNGGGAIQVTVGDSVFSGTQIRTLLDLPSTAFCFDFTMDNVIVTTRGNGHRVGMSQYGADAMAVAGSTYSEILMHYYPGTELVTFTAEQMQSIFDKV